MKEKCLQNTPDKLSQSKAKQELRTYYSFFFHFN